MAWSDARYRDEATADDIAKIALTAYAKGVNDRIDEAKKAHQLPVMFTLLGYEPQWSWRDNLADRPD